MNADQDKPDADTLTLAPETERDEQALSLTDFLDIAALQEVQDSFSSVTRLETTIRDADGESITAPTDSEGRSQSDTVLDFLLTGDAHDADDDSIDDAAFVAPIVVDGRELGYIEIAEYARPAASRANRNELREVAEALGVSLEELGAEDHLPVVMIGRQLHPSLARL